MKHLWQISFDDFLDKVDLWMITEKSLTKVLYEVSRKFHIFYLPTPEADYCAVTKELTTVQKMKLLPICISAHLVKEDVSLSKKSIDSLKPLFKSEPKVVIEDAND